MNKRKRVVLTFQQKLDILKQLNEGKSGRILAQEYGIGTSTISDIKRNGDAILQFVSSLECQNQISEKKTRKTAQNTDLDSQVYKWYVEEKKNGVLQMDSVICAKALEINKQLANASQNFKASPGWLRHFKYRHGIKEAKEQNEESQTTSTVTRQFRSFLKRGAYTLENVYNADESVLYWNSLPNCEEKCQSTVSMILCTNANASHKLTPCIIGSERVTNPSDVVYKYQNNPGINLTLFEDWFENSFLTEVKRRQQNTGNVGKILLVLDDASWHPDPDNLVKNRDDVDILILSDHMVPPVQPMALEAKHKFKMIFRKKLLELLLAKSPCPIKQFLEEFSLEDSFPLITEAWECTPKSTILLSWKTLFSDAKDETEISLEEISEMVSLTEQIPPLNSCNRTNIIQWIHYEKEDCSYSMEDDLDPPPIKETTEGPSHLEAYQCLDTVIQWFTRQEECSKSQLATLQNLHDLAAAKLCGNIKQEND